MKSHLLQTIILLRSKLFSFGLQKLNPMDRSETKVFQHQSNFSFTHLQERTPMRSIRKQIDTSVGEVQELASKESLHDHANEEREHDGSIAGGQGEAEYLTREEQTSARAAASSS